MARQQLDMSHDAEEGRLERLWDAYKAQEDELRSLQEELEKASKKAIQFETKFSKEEERLQKLWDAYCVQEDELTELREKLPLMEEKLVERQKVIEALENDIDLLEPLTKKGQNAAELAIDNDRLRADIEILEARLKAQGDDPKPVRHAGAAAELKQVEKELDEERERLEKLYSLYQDQEDEVRHLRDTIQEWEAWSNKVKPILDKASAS